MNAWPRRCSRGPHSRIGIRLAPACTSMSGSGGLLDPRRIEHERVGRDAVADRDAVQLQQVAHDLDVADLRDVGQDRGLVSEYGGHHRLGDEILGATDGDLAHQRRTT